VNSRSKVLFTVAEKIEVPAKNEVPRIIANEVSNNRPLRASVIFNESRNILFGLTIRRDV
jgi:hypothetical protein